ncbi:HNH endonuclease [Blastopirellula sp. JC732]|uniref:HNH endonuclease n=1 Tax=Blastopirellula sediminis TaxID=2894196 RepID=A0A9X1MN48_9BACT|nr:HNH endonuclease signature motif containing protein [Blastopirellula sediminis]MCC9608689.1 HNH endonuclease [Blastopirellula sediminis]MCC9628534.1 HNH endonuclease [Blastopirellula sediminis]
MSSADSTLACNQKKNDDVESRVRAITDLLERALAQDPESFSVSTAMAVGSYDPQQLDQAKQAVYRKVIVRAWEDGQLTPDEQETARWIAEKLELPEGEYTAIELELAKKQFASALSRAMADGVLDADDQRRLQKISDTIGMPMSTFAGVFFQAEGEKFLRGMFLEAIADNHLMSEEWASLLSSADKLGISHQEFLQAIRFQAREFVEHVIVDAKADGVISPHEEETMVWLLQQLEMPSDFCQYAVGEMARLKSRVEGSPALEVMTISRDLRDRIWRKYNGRCGACGAGNYLEMVRIIPKAMGGGDDEANIQLLCRRCVGQTHA